MHLNRGYFCYQLALSIVFSLFTFKLLAEETLVSCNYTVEEETLKEHVSYLVLRDGDRLYSRYRESESREFTITDDIIYRLFENEKLDELKAEGKVAPIAAALETTEDKINSITFYGVDQFDPDEDEDEGEGEEEEEKFKMILWKAKSSLGTWLGTVAQTDEGLTHRCSSRRGFFFFLK